MKKIVGIKKKPLKILNPLKLKILSMHLTIMASPHYIYQKLDKNFLEKWYYDILVVRYVIFGNGFPLASDEVYDIIGAMWQA